MSGKKTILVVDDIPRMRTMLVKHLKSLGLKSLKEEVGVDGLEILEAATGKEAIHCLSRFNVDVKILDLMMPEMDGQSFLEARKKAPKATSVPITVCSALGEKAKVEKAMGLGAMSYIGKPFTLKSIEDKFREAMTALQS